MLKVRVMGNKDEIHWFQEILSNCNQMHVNDFSDVFTCANTRKYYRAYCQVQKKTQLKKTK